MSNKINRADQVSVDNTNAMKIGLYQIDAIIKYYFDNVIMPTVETEEGLKAVPVIYASPDRWKSVQKTGLLKDELGKLQLPAIAYKRTSMENVVIGSKVDPNNPLIQSFQTAYSKKNRYDNFEVLTGRSPIKEYHNVVVPDYVKLSYDCIVWTDHLTQLNTILEDVNYAANSYWGNDQFKFLSKISSYSTDLAVESGEDRAAKATFTIEMNGYIIPNNIQKALSKYNPKAFSPAVVSVGGETVVDLNNLPNNK